jgi:hypothetical protein
MENLVLKRKKRELEELLNDEYILVFVNPGYEGVDLPEHIRGLPSATLKLSRHFRGTLSVSDEEVRAELLFGPNYYCCVLPLPSIWAAKGAGGREVVWQSEHLAVTPPPTQVLVPDDTSTVTPTKDDTTPESKQTKPKRGAPQLRRIK